MEVMTAFCPAAQAVALITAQRAGLDHSVAAAMVSEAIHDGAASDHELVNRLSRVLGTMAALAAHACDEWDRAAGDDLAGRWLAEVGQAAAQT
jgi:hypothetical protein